MPPIYTFKFNHKTISKIEISIDAYDFKGAINKLVDVVNDPNDWVIQS